LHFRSVNVHVFGAYFGLAASYTLQHRKIVESPKESSSYASDIFSMIGTLFLFCFWPSFNAGTAYGDGRLRAIVNTYISISASVILTFIISAIVGKGKEEIIHIQNATLAGGVAIGTMADKNVGIFGAMIVGSIAGTVSTLGYKYLLEILKRVHIHDTCGVHNLHGMPGVISGLGGIVIASMPWRSLYTENLTPTCLGGGLNRTPAVQAGFQCAGLVLTLAMAIVGGLGTGLFLRLPIFATPDNDSYFDDSLNWHVPQDFVAQDSAIGNLIRNLMPNDMKHEETPNEEITDVQTPNIHTNNPNTIEVINEITPRYSIEPKSIRKTDGSASLFITRL
jgi:ammonium transporter Rh